VVTRNLCVSTEPEELAKAHLIFPVTGIDAIFLSSDAHDACLIRPFLGTGLPIYTTSHAYEGVRADSRCLDMQWVHFMEMP